MNFLLISPKDDKNLLMLFLIFFGLTFVIPFLGALFGGGKGATSFDGIIPFLFGLVAAFLCFVAANIIAIAQFVYAIFGYRNTRAGTLVIQISPFLITCSFWTTIIIALR